MNSNGDDSTPASKVETGNEAWSSQHLRNRPFTPKSLAERWQVSETHVRNLAKEGKLGHFRIGKMYRFPADSVRAFEQVEASSLPAGSEGNEANPHSDLCVVCIPEESSPWTKR